MGAFFIILISTIILFVLGMAALSFVLRKGNKIIAKKKNSFKRDYAGEKEFTDKVDTIKEIIVENDFIMSEEFITGYCGVFFDDTNENLFIIKRGGENFPPYIKYSDMKTIKQFSTSENNSEKDLKICITFKNHSEDLVFTVDYVSNNDPEDYKNSLTTSSKIYKAILSRIRFNLKNQ